MDGAHVSREQRRLFYRTWAPRIARWKVLGYFDPGNRERNFEAKLPPENFPVLTNTVYEGAKEKMIPWRDFESARLNEDGRTVVLITTELMRRTDYSILVSRVFDTNDPPQLIEANSRTAFAVRGNGTGLTARYFNNEGLTDLKLERVDPTVDFDWNAGSPMESMEPDTFSVRWTGSVEPLYSGEYLFHGVTDDGVRLWVDGELLIDKWTDQSATDHIGKITLEADKAYNIKMEMYERGGGASAKLFWSSKKQPREIIPASPLYPEE
jgi:hypothetical protein